MQKNSINIKGRLLNFDKPLVMGIVNITPDSFFEQSRVTTNQQILQRVHNIMAQGATIIDVGAYSSRPGAMDIPVIEEINRLQPALETIKAHYPEVPISIDTFRSEVARFAVNNFAVDIINDISGGLSDPNMFETIAQLNVAYILMHMQGTPQNMQTNPVYKDVVGDISLFFAQQLDKLAWLGVKDVILDPGFGFGKTTEHNYQLLERLHEFSLFSQPILAGLSRKSMIYKTLNTTPSDALNGTTVLNTIALLKGANILRVHDVKEAMECVKLVETLQKSSNGISSI